MIRSHTTHIPLRQSGVNREIYQTQKLLNETKKELKKVDKKIKKNIRKARLSFFFPKAKRKVASLVEYRKVLSDRYTAVAARLDIERQINRNQHIIQQQVRAGYYPGYPTGPYIWGGDHHNQAYGGGAYGGYSQGGHALGLQNSAGTSTHHSEADIPQRKGERVRFRDLATLIEYDQDENSSSTSRSIFGPHLMREARGAEETDSDSSSTSSEEVSLLTQSWRQRASCVSGSIPGRSPSPSARIEYPPVDYDED